MVMEFLDGESLGERIKTRGRLTAAASSVRSRPAARGLAAAHGAGIIHRDLKPDNVFLLEQPRRQAGLREAARLRHLEVQCAGGDSGFSMTRTGAVMGTPYYMAPEQAKGARDLDHRVDHLRRGRHPVRGAHGAGAVQRRHVQRAPVQDRARGAAAARAGRPQASIPASPPSSPRRWRATRASLPERERVSERALDVGSGHGAELAAALGPGAARGASGRDAARAGAPTLGTGTPGTWAQSGTHLEGQGDRDSRRRATPGSSPRSPLRVSSWSAAAASSRWAFSGDTAEIKPDERPKRRQPQLQPTAHDSRPSALRRRKRQREAERTRAEAAKTMADATKAKDEARRRQLPPLPQPPPKPRQRPLRDPPRGPQPPRPLPPNPLRPRKHQSPRRRRPRPAGRIRTSL